MRALLIGGGPVDLNQLRMELDDHPDLVIAADGGGSYLLELGELPHVLLGDFDSLTDDDLERFDGTGVELVRFPVAKDQTDLELALDLAVERGVTAIRILGGLGGRLDHTLGNVGLLIKACRLGIEARLLDSGHELRIAERRIVLEARPGWAVSLIPLTSKATGVRTAGLVFPLNGEELEIGSTRGLHNRFEADTATVELDDGLLLIIYFLEQPNPFRQIETSDPI